MALPTFQSFSFQDSNFITERILFKGYASRAVTRANANRREGVRLLSTEFGEKSVTLEGRIIADSASDLQSKLDGMKSALVEEEGDLEIESGRVFKATVSNVKIPDDPYNQSTVPFEVTFVCSNPYAEGAEISAGINIPSGQFTISGTIVISGTMFARPTVTYTPAGASTGNTNIDSFTLNHVNTGQQIVVSGFGGGLGLDYGDAVVINTDTFVSLEGSSIIDSSGAFPRWEPESNSFTVSADGRFVGGNLAITYKPRYL